MVIKYKRVGDYVSAKVDAAPKEIAALALAVQERQKIGPVAVEIDGRAIAERALRKAIDGIRKAGGPESQQTDSECTPPQKI